MQRAVEPAWVLTYLLMFQPHAEPENLGYLDFLAIYFLQGMIHSETG